MIDQHFINTFNESDLRAYLALLKDIFFSINTHLRKMQSTDKLIFSDTIA